MIDSIVLMTDERTRKSFEAMSAEDAGNILKGLLRHAAGEEIDDSDWSPLALAVYPLIEGQVDRMTQLRENRSAAGRAGGEAKANNSKPVANCSKPVANEQQNVPPVPEPIPVPEQKKESPSGIRKKAPERFVPPTMDDVKEFVVEQGLRMDPERFWNHFQSNGWKVGGKAPMKDWHAAARNWAARDKLSKPPDVPKDTRKIDYDAATREMFLAGLKGATG